VHADDFEVEEEASQAGRLAAAALGTAVPIRAAYVALAEATDRNHWTERSPVSAEVLDELARRVPSNAPAGSLSSGLEGAASPSVFTLACDPNVVSEEEYQELVRCLGDLVRASGGLGVARHQPQAHGAPAMAGGVG
jgi:hypothetical protein